MCSSVQSSHNASTSSHLSLLFLLLHLFSIPQVSLLFLFVLAPTESSRYNASSLQLSPNASHFTLLSVDSRIPSPLFLTLLSPLFPLPLFFLALFIVAAAFHTFFSSSCAHRSRPCFGCYSITISHNWFRRGVTRSLKSPRAKPHIASHSSLLSLLLLSVLFNPPLFFFFFYLHVHRSLTPCYSLPAVLSNLLSSDPNISSLPPFAHILLISLFLFFFLISSHINSSILILSLP